MAKYLLFGYKMVSEKICVIQLKGRLFSQEYDLTTHELSNNNGIRKIKLTQSKGEWNHKEKFSSQMGKSRNEVNHELIDSRDHFDTIDNSLYSSDNDYNKNQGGICLHEKD